MIEREEGRKEGRSGIGLYTDIRLMPFLEGLSKSVDGWLGGERGRD